MATNNTNKPLSIKDIMSRKLPAMVTEGRHDKVKLKEIKEYPITDTNKKEFLRLTYVTQDGREISENRFAQGLNIMVSHIREQLELQDTDFDSADLFTPGKLEFSIWVQKQFIINNAGEKMRVTNVHFLQPLDWENKDTPASDEQKADNPTGDPLPEV